jgi:hypothetical protein
MFKERGGGMNSEEESRRLRTVAQETRLHTIRVELALAFTWCSVARTEADMGEAAQFQNSMKRIRRAADSLRVRIHEPQHVPPEMVPGFEAQLTQLEGTVHALESAAKRGFQG